MRLLFFMLKIFLKRLAKALVISPALTAIILFLGIVLGVYGINLHLEISESRFVFLLSILGILGCCGAFIEARTLEAALFRHGNSRYSNRVMLRCIMAFRAFKYSVPTVLAVLALMTGILSTAGEDASRGKPLAETGLFWGGGFFLALLIQGARMGGGRRPAAAGSRPPRPRLKSLLADYAAPDYLLAYLLLLCASVYLLAECMLLLRSGGAEARVIHNYGLVFLLIPGFSFGGLLGSVERMNWKVRAFFDLGYASYARRSFGFLAAASVPLWLPFWILYLGLSPSGALRFLLYLILGLAFTVNFALSRIHGLIKGLLWFGFTALGAIAFYLGSPLGFILVLPALFFFVRARETIYDWGRYD
jgi:hypothetical protein